MLANNQMQVVSQQVSISSQFDPYKGYCRQYQYISINDVVLIDNKLILKYSSGKHFKDELVIPFTKVNKIKVFDSLFSQIGWTVSDGSGEVELDRLVGEDALLITSSVENVDMEYYFVDLVLKSQISSEGCED